LVNCVFDFLKSDSCDFDKQRLLLQILSELAHPSFNCTELFEKVVA